MWLCVLITFVTTIHCVEKGSFSALPFPCLSCWQHVNSYFSSCDTAKVLWKSFTMTIISIGKKVFGGKMLWRLFLFSWTHQICLPVGKIWALFLLVFILYVCSTFHILLNHPLLALHQYGLFFSAFILSSKHISQKVVALWLVIFFMQVMQELGLIGLRIQRMPSEPGLEFGIPSQYSYMTV